MKTLGGLGRTMEDWLDQRAVECLGDLRVSWDTKSRDI